MPTRAPAETGACAPAEGFPTLGRQRKTQSFLISPSLPGPRSLRARKPTRKAATNIDYLAVDPARHPSFYFSIVGFPRLPCACALFFHPLLPRCKPRHRVASCCGHPPSAARVFCVLASRRATSRVRLTPRGSLPVCSPTRASQELTSERDPIIQGAKHQQPGAPDTITTTDQPTPPYKLRHTLEAPFVNLAGKPTAPSSPSARD